MSDQTTQERSLFGVAQLSLRSLILGMIGSMIITASSMYVALRMSALPWPTIFVAILSMAILKALGKTTLNEINITQTAMSAGAMVAGGLAFTIPGLWITGVWQGKELLAQHFWEVLAISLAGMILGTVLTWYARNKFVIKEKLPYPIGQAAAEAIVVGDSGGKKSANLFGSMFLASIFTFLRDGIGIIPMNIGVLLSPLAISTGYIIGTLYTGVWFLGGVLAYWIIIPLGPALKIFPSVDSAIGFKTTTGIGLMVGTGIGVLLAYLISIIKKTIHSASLKQTHQDASVYSGKVKLLSLIALLVAYILTILSGMEPIPSCLLLIGITIASTMASTITGETGINPMEIFGIIILLAIRLFVKVDMVHAFFIAAGVAIACGYAGDLLNDYKTGQVLNTNPVAQLISQVVGGIFGTLVATVSLFAVINQFGGVGSDFGLPAAQSFAVSQMVGGIGDPLVFGIAATIGALLYLFKVPVMTLGIGMLLPLGFSAAAFIGGIIRFFINRFNPRHVESGNITASGFLGGEGLTGVGLAIFKMFF